MLAPPEKKDGPHGKTQGAVQNKSQTCNIYTNDMIVATDLAFDTGGAA